MAASQDECVAAYARSQTCTDRLYSRLLSWASYTLALPMPPTDTAPDVGWVQQRVVAERTPANGVMYAQQLAAYTLEDPTVTQNLRTMLNPYNDETTESQLATYIDDSLAVVMPKLAAATVTDQDVATWCQRNGYPVPPDLTTGPSSVTSPPPTPTPAWMRPVPPLLS